LNVHVEQLASVSENILRVKLSFNDDIAFVIAIVYRSPHNSPFSIDEYIYEILESEYAAFQSRFPECKFIFTGDFNGRTGTDAEY
jgi:hypothetical protein